MQKVCFTEPPLLGIRLKRTQNTALRVHASGAKTRFFPCWHSIQTNMEGSRVKVDYWIFKGMKRKHALHVISLRTAAPVYDVTPDWFVKTVPSAKSAFQGVSFERDFDMHNKASILALHLLRPYQTVNGWTFPKIFPTPKQAKLQVLPAFLSTNKSSVCRERHLRIIHWSCTFLHGKKETEGRKRTQQECWSTCCSEGHRWTCATLSRTLSRTSPKLSTRFQYIF